MHNMCILYNVLWFENTIWRSAAHFDIPHTKIISINHYIVRNFDLRWIWRDRFLIKIVEIFEIKEHLYYCIMNKKAIQANSFLSWVVCYLCGGVFVFFVNWSNLLYMSEEAKLNRTFVEFVADTVIVAIYYYACARSARRYTTNITKLNWTNATFF